MSLNIYSQILKHIISKKSDDINDTYHIISSLSCHNLGFKKLINVKVMQLWMYHIIINILLLWVFQISLFRIWD